MVIKALNNKGILVSLQQFIRSYLYSSNVLNLKILKSSIFLDVLLEIRRWCTVLEYSVPVFNVYIFSIFQPPQTTEDTLLLWGGIR